MGPECKIPIDQLVPPLFQVDHAGDMPSAAVVVVEYIDRTDGRLALYMVRSEGAPSWRILGLLDGAQIWMRRVFSVDEDDD